MGAVSTGTTIVAFGSNLRIGYKIHGSSDPFTYLSFLPAYADLPYTFTLPTGFYDIEYSEVCPTCSSPAYSTPVQTSVNVT